MDGSLPKPERDKEARQIYLKYGVFTTAGSLLATWAVIRTLFPQQAPLLAETHTTAAKVATPALTATARALQRPDAAQLLLKIATANDYKAGDAKASDIPSETVEKLKSYLESINVPYDSSDIDYRLLSFTDEWNTSHILYLAHVSNDDAESFRGSYLFEESEIVAKQEFVSS